MLPKVQAARRLQTAGRRGPHLRTVAGSRGLDAQATAQALSDAAREYADRLNDDLQMLALRLP